eukprot:COSAG04_NODE_2999_length_3292_cov_3.443232_5_plen_91_part_01
MDDAVLVEVAQRKQQLRRVEARLPLLEEAHLAQVVEYLPAVDKVHHQVQLGLGLEGVVQLDDERVPNPLQHAALRAHPIDLAAAYDVRLGH